jgi:hypothetical protein
MAMEAMPTDPSGEGSPGEGDGRGKLVVVGVIRSFYIIIIVTYIFRFH